MAHKMPQVDGVRHRYEAAGKLNFHVAEAGAGEPLLLLHGWPQHWYCWRAVIPALAEHYRVLAVDLRGFGWTDIAWEGLGKETMAGDIASLMETLEIDRARIVGHDWGGWIGYLLALRRPELVERLVALAIPPPFAPFSFRAMAAGRHFGYQAVLASPFGVRRLSHPGYVAKTMRRWSERRENLPREVRRMYGRDLRASTRARAASLLYRTWLLRELGPVVFGRYRGQRLTVPTLVLHGERDNCTPPALFQGHERFADDLTVESVPGAGHMLPEECPELVAERALAHFGPREAAAAAAA